MPCCGTAVWAVAPGEGGRGRDSEQTPCGGVQTYRGLCDGTHTSVMCESDETHTTGWRGQVAHGLRNVIGCCKDRRRRRRCSSFSASPTIIFDAAGICSVADNL